MLESNQILPSSRDYMDKHSDYENEEDLLKKVTLKTQMERLKIEYQKWIDNEKER